VIRRNGRCAEVDVAGTTLKVPHEGRPAQGDVNVYIRPEKVRLAGADARATGCITTRVFVGNQWLLQVDTGLGRLSVAQPNFGAPPPEEGEHVGLVWSDDDLRMLAKETGDGHA
jgi:putative spermidine/putrescine transport system ATP-binding protein